MILTVAVMAVLALVFPLDEAVISESAEHSGLLESSQLILWLAAAAIGGLAAFGRSLHSRDRLLRGWMAVVSITAALREGDAHERLNPERLEAHDLAHLGVSFRIDWWLDTAVPAWLKLCWLAVFATATLGLALPLLVARVPFIRLGIRGHFAVQCMAISLLCLALGYAADDLVGRGQFVSRATSKSAEELLELLGALFWVAATLAWSVGRIPLLQAPDLRDPDPAPASRTGGQPVDTSPRRRG